MEQRFETFTALIASISRSIRKIKSEKMLEFNLKSSHVSCLYYLYKSGALTAKELCERCDEDKASISRSIDYLEKNGYIICHSNTPKRYRAPLELTTKGAEIGSYICEKIDNILLKSSDGVSEEHRKIMYESLIKINNNLQQFCKKEDD